MPKRLSYEEVRQRVQTLTDCELLETEFVNVKTQMRFRCRCGNEFVTSFNKFQNDHRQQCTECAKRAQYREKRLSLDELKARLAHKGCEYVSGEYVNQRSKVMIRFACGHTGLASGNRISAKNFPGVCEGCFHKELAERQRYTPTRVAILSYALGAELLSDHYESEYQPLRFRCVCGSEFEACWNNVQSGQTRCRVCAGRVSKGEYAVQRWLESRGIPYVPQKRFLDCAGARPYSFDFFLPAHSACIEFDGEQHFRPTAFARDEEHFAALKARDRAKDAYCDSHGLQMIRIPYTEIDDIPTILESKLIPR